MIPILSKWEMSRLKRRLEKLEAQLTDVSCFAPHTREWLAYWERRVDRILTGEDSGLIPLDVVDAIVAAGVEPDCAQGATQGL